MAFRNRGASPTRHRTSIQALFAFAEAWLLLQILEVCLGWFSFQRVERWFAPRQLPQVDAAPSSSISSCLWATRAAARRSFRPVHCLPQALCLRWLLGRRGIASILRIGVLRGHGRLLAHAWVEWEGRPVGEAPEEIARFSLLEGDDQASFPKDLEEVLNVSS